MYIVENCDSRARLVSLSLTPKDFKLRLAGEFVGGRYLTESRQEAQMIFEREAELHEHAAGKVSATSMYQAEISAAGKPITSTVYNQTRKIY